MKREYDYRIMGIKTQVITTDYTYQEASTPSMQALIEVNQQFLPFLQSNFDFFLLSGCRPVVSKGSGTLWKEHCGRILWQTWKMELRMVTKINDRYKLWEKQISMIYRWTLPKMVIPKQIRPSWMISLLSHVEGDVRVLTCLCHL